ncbi:hypothetical protein [Streptomyces caniscabiei]|uniref:hypothetical protein n=1 Tax=Streptomyces caniscabiei TaxID=2746961 RepID=UPI0029B3A80E|nr:hypothetical protein [Streptomyces caniscabiei]MDX2986471.1 hypothetical protein [Streptomyces caniscabiei]
MSTLLTILVAAVTAVVAAIATGLIATPRLEARKKRITEAHAARDSLGTQMLTVLSACSLLQQVPADDPDWTPVLRERLQGERQRWLQQLDEATRWIIDHVMTYAGTWPSRPIINLAVSYASRARMVMLSEREEATKLELLVALTLPVQCQFFGYWWSRARHYVDDQRTFAETVARLDQETGPQPDPAALPRPASGEPSDAG